MEATKINEAVTDGTLQNFFTGSVPRNYDTYMGPVLFTPYALDLTARIRFADNVKILELACGTGRVTKEIISHLPVTATLVATDISTDMMDIAEETIAANNLSWEVVDMAAIPYEDETFDVIVCQFGLMFVPDKIKALTEMRRVLKTGGQLLFNTWGNIDENPMWKIGFASLNSFLGSSPFPKELGPFGLPETAPVLQMMEAVGFTSSKAEQVRITSEMSSASSAAEAFLMTSPVLEKQPALFPEIQKSLSKELSEKLGDNPMQAPLMALVFEATK